MEYRTTGTRSRLGCLTCRRRHKKCDEERPTCRACQKGSRRCEYGNSSLKWTAVCHAGIATKLRKNNRGDPTPHSPPTAREDGLTETPNDWAISFIGPEVATISEQHYAALPVSDYFPLSTQHPNMLLSHESYPTSQIGDSMDYGAIMMAYESFGPTMVQTLTLPRHDELTQTVEGLQGDCLNEDNDPTENNANQASIAESTLGNLVMNSCPGSYLSTALTNTYEKIAYSFYINYASAHIPALDSPRNPYRQLCVIALSYPLLLQTLLYVSAVGMFYHGKGNMDLMESCRAKAFKSLQTAESHLQFDKTNHCSNKKNAANTKNHEFSVMSSKEVTLASILMHIVPEVMCGTKNADAHIKRAYDIMADLEYLETIPRSFYAQFLVKRFAIVDIVLSFLRHRRPVASMSFVLYHQNGDPQDSEPSFRELTGCPWEVLAFLAKISFLASDTTNPERSRQSVMEDAYQLETEMRIWAQRYRPASSCGPLSRHFGQTFRNDNTYESYGEREDLDILSECFYWTAELLLIRRVFLEPTVTSRVQFITTRLFDLMGSLRAGCGPDSSLPFPFYMAAREALCPENRKWVRQRHQEMMSIYHDKSREIMMNVTEAIWSRIDEIPNLRDMSLDVYIYFLDNEASHCIF
ncbi:fungal-specific transcription factor domain-containing protein [Trichoderma evansii]